MRRYFVVFLISLFIIFGLLSSGVMAETIELEMWTFVSDHQDYYEDRAEEFNEQNPDFEFVLNASTSPVDQMHDNLLSSLIAGVGAPDIVDLNIQWAGKFMKNNPQFFVNLNDLVEDYEDVLHQERLKCYTDPEGNVLGLPTHIGTGVMYYVKPVFDDAGIDIDAIEYYEDDWIDALKKVTDKENDVYGTFAQTTLARELLLYTMQKGGYMIDPEGELAIHKEEGLEALQFIHDLVHEHEVAVIAPGGSVGEPAFYDKVNRGEIASLPYAQWYMTRFRNFMPDLEGDVAVRTLPLWEPEGNTSATMGGTGTAILDGSDHQEVAKEFLEFSKLTYDANVLIATDFGLDPPRLDVYDDPALREPDPYFNNEPVFPTVKEAMERLVAKPVWPQNTEVMMKLNRDTVYNVLQGNQTPKEALMELKEELMPEFE